MTTPDFNDPEETIIADNGVITITKDETDSEKEALERLWNQFNSADDLFLLHVSRKTPNSHKEVQCFSDSVTGDLNVMIEKCREEFIPLHEQSAEFIFKVQDKKSGKFKGKKHIGITRSNSDFNKKETNNPLDSDIMKVISRQIEKTQEQSLSLMEKMLERREETPNTTLKDLMNSPVMLAAIPLIFSAMKPKELPPPPQPVSMKEMIETMVLLQNMAKSPESGGEEPGFGSVVNTLIEKMGAPIAAGAMALQNRQKDQAAIQHQQQPPALPAGSQEIDKTIEMENTKRSQLPVDQLPVDQLPPDAKDAETFLKGIIGLSYHGAKRNAPPEQYAQVILDQVEPEQLNEFSGFINDPNVFAVVQALEPGYVEYADWFKELITHMNKEIAELLTPVGDGELTHDVTEPIVADSQISDTATDSPDYDYDEQSSESSHDTIDEHLVGAEGNEADPGANEAPST